MIGIDGHVRLYHQGRLLLNETHPPEVARAARSSERSTEACAYWRVGLPAQRPQLARNPPRHYLGLAACGTGPCRFRLFSARSGLIVPRQLVLLVSIRRPFRLR